MKIAVKTKITEWGAAGEKEKIAFDLLDLSPDQVGNIDRLIRHNSEDKVKLTIEPCQKKLQIPAIVSQVRLVSMNCMAGGQKLKIADFASPDERATAMKRMTNADTQITLTIEDVQGKLFKEEKVDQANIHFDRDDYTVNEHGVVENPSFLVVKLPKSYRTKIEISWARVKGKFYIGYDVKTNQAGSSSPVSNKHEGFEKFSEALDKAALVVCKIIEKQQNYKYVKQAKTKVIKAVENYMEGVNE